MTIYSRGNQLRNWNILKNRHYQYIVDRINATVADADNRASLLRHVRGFGNPARKIVRYLSPVHSRPVCRTTEDPKLDEKFWKLVDPDSLALSGRHAEYFANGQGDSFVYIFKNPRTKLVQYKFIPCHTVSDMTLDVAGDIEKISVVTSAGLVEFDYKNMKMTGSGADGKRVTTDLKYRPIVHYRLDETEDLWCCDLVDPIFDITIEIGVQIAMFLETGYLRAHEQMSIAEASPELSPQDVGDIKVGTNKVIPFKITSTSLVSADVAEKFFASMQNLAIFAAEQEGIPKSYYLQEPGGVYPPDMRVSWMNDCRKWQVRDLQVLHETGLLLAADAQPWDPQTEWYLQYQEPLGMTTRKDQLENLEKEIDLGLNDPIWFLFTTDGDFRTYDEAKAFYDHHVDVWSALAERKAARNGAVAGAATPQENGAAGGNASAKDRMSKTYDGSGGPRPLPPDSFEK